MTESTQLAAELMSLYPVALPEVYGFLYARCGDAALAEDLTADTFMSAVSAVESRSVDRMTVGWLIVVARRRLIDHWRRLEVEQRVFTKVDVSETVDPWDEVLDLDAARSALARVAPQHRAALTLRYVDGFSVPEVAEHLERGLHATEALLQRARRALRAAYLAEASNDA